MIRASNTVVARICRLMRELFSFRLVAQGSLCRSRGQRFLVVAVCALFPFCSSVTCATAQEQEASSAHNAEEKPLPAATEMVIYGAPLVTALHEVPQSATVVTGELLKEKGDTSFQSQIESVPGLSWSGGTSRPRFCLIRGVGELEQYEGAPNPSVATIIDGIDFSGLGLITPLYDVEQVEVLRGPQGVRFGSSALAGALNVRSNDPTSFTTGEAEVMAGNDSLLAGGVAVGGAVPGTDDRLQLRFSAFNTQSDGFRDNLYLDRTSSNGRDESVARLKVRYEASGDLSFDLGLWGAAANNGYDAFAIDNSLKTQSDRPGQDDTSVFATSFKTKAALSNSVNLESMTTFARTHIDYSFDGDWGHNAFWHPYDPYDYFSDSNRTRKVYGEELRLSQGEEGSYVHGESWRSVGGLFAQRLSEGSDTTELSNNEVYDFIDSDYQADTGAVFGQVEAPLATGTSLVTGLRVEHRSTEYDDSRASSFSPAFTMLGGSVALQHDLSDTVRGYMTSSRGYKGGGFNAGPSVPTERRLYDPEYLWNFEVGAKGDFLNRRLVSNIALFYDLRRNQTLKRAIQDDPSDPLSFTYVTESVAEGAGSGIELENSFAVQPWLTVFGSGSVMHTSFTEVPADTDYLTSRSFSHAPNWQYSTGVRAQATDELFVRLEVTGKDGFYFDDSHDQKSSSYDLLNASVGYVYGGWKVILWGRNLGNQAYAVRGFYFGNEPPDFPSKVYIQRGDPRAFGATVSYAF